MASPEEEFDIGIDQAVERLRQPDVDSFFLQTLSDLPDGGFRHEYEYHHKTDDPGIISIRNRRLIGMFLKTYADEMDVEVEEVAEFGIEAANDLGGRE